MLRIRENVQSKKINLKKTDTCESYLGPGCYELSREFDRGQSAGKGNPMVTKVH